MRVQPRRVWALALLSLLVSGCSIMPGAPQLAPQSDAAREQLQQWTLKGRITTADNRALMRWQQDAEEFNIVLRGPFGLGAVRIVGNPQRATFDDGKESTQSLDPQADIYRQTGIWVPVAALPYWLRALPAPGAQSRIERDALDQVSVLHQYGWTVHYAQWQLQQGSNLALPMLIEIQGEEPLLSLEISRWVLP